jgi:hypothetical protein
VGSEEVNEQGKSGERRSGRPPRSAAQSVVWRSLLVVVALVAIVVVGVVDRR